MIKKFSTLYAGHVDLDNIGIDGTGANDRRFQNEHLVSVFDKTESIASLTDLFSLARKGIDGQMRAHLDGKEWMGEKINARAFRECFRMVTQTVKGLGLPSEERTRAKSAIMDEVAEALKDTQETVALAPGGDDEEVEH